MSEKSKIIPPNALITNWLIWNANAKKSSPTLLIETRLPARFSRNARHFPTRSLLPSSASHTRDLDRGHRPAPSSLPPAAAPLLFPGAGPQTPPCSARTPALARPRPLPAAPAGGCCPPSPTCCARREPRRSSHPPCYARREALLALSSSLLQKPDCPSSGTAHLTRSRL